MTEIELIAAERKRQIEEEGWTAEHDEQWKKGELAKAAMCYAMPPERPPYLYYSALALGLELVQGRKK
jgi:hypothetical protein